MARDGSLHQRDGMGQSSANLALTGVGVLGRTKAGRTQDLHVVVLQFTPVLLTLLHSEQMQLLCC